MKYIRTKDEIYEIIGGIVHTIFPPQYRNRYKSKLVVIDKVIKQVDTIEELCDEFVVWFDELTLPSQFTQWHLAKKYKNVFGAIWTEKGLIYVAKMNEKGELELI